MSSHPVFLNPIEFSVIVPLYNKEKSISSTIESVLKQTHPNFELIIVNDGSTDQSVTVAQSYNDSRIKIINKENGGVSSARNLGIEVSQKQLIVFLDADDFWLPFCLEEFCTLINEFPEAQVFCTNYNMTGKNLEGSDRRYYVEDYFYTSAYYMARWSIPIMLTGCVAVMRKILFEVGNFNQNISHGEDIDMWQRLAKYARIAKSEKITTIYRTDTENRASLLDESHKLKSDQIEIKRHGSLSHSQKLFYGIQFVFEIRENKSARGKNQALKNLLKFPDWIVRGVIFIIKVRILNIHLSPYIQKEHIW